MVKDLDLSIKEVDDLLQHLYLKLKGRKEGLSLAEPAAILLAVLKRENPAFYEPQLSLFTPIIMDTLISGAYVSFGYEGLQAIDDIAGDISLATGDYVPTGVEEGLSWVRGRIDSIESILDGTGTGDGISAVAGEGGLSGTKGFARERAWGTVGLPLVSIYNTGKNPFSTGRVVMARIEVRLTGEWSVRHTHDPVISFEHISAEPNSRFERQIRTAIEAAEDYAIHNMGLKGVLRIPREYRISLPEIASFPSQAIQRLSGGSAGLAVSALLISLLSKLDLHRRRLDIPADISFTGAVDGDGKVLAVEDSHIADKVRAVFFSNFSSLVLPDENLDTAAAALSDLERDYPNRKLMLIPAGEVGDIFTDSGAAASSSVPAGKPVLQRIMLWRKHLLASLTPVVLAIMFLFILPPYLDDKVGVVEIGTDRIEMKNKYGRPLSRYEFGFTTQRLSQYVKYYFHDLDKREGTEILCLVCEPSRTRHRKGNSNRLHFLLFSEGGELLRSYAFTPEEYLRDEMDAWAFDKIIALVNSSPVFLDELGMGKVVVGMHFGTFSPAALVKADLGTGRFEPFFHRGYFPEMTSGDFDEDGKREILLVGNNLPLESAVLIVLDPEHMQGSSPGGYNYSPDGMTADIAKYYMRFPESRRAVRYVGPNYPFGLAIVENGDTVEVAVKSHGVDIRYLITEGMEVVGAEVIENQNQEVATPDGVSPAEFRDNAKEAKRLLSNILYWNGKDWVSEPTVNLSYLAHSGIDVDMTIARVGTAGENIVFYNDLGVEIASHATGFEISDGRVYNRTFKGDFLDSNGEEFVCALLDPDAAERGDNENNVLFVKVFNEKGRLISEHAYSEWSVLGNEIERASRLIDMQMDLFTSSFQENFGDRSIYFLTHHKMEPPASLIRFDVEHGLFEPFFHKGYMREMRPYDAEGDGADELLLVGYNMILAAPVIVLLDPHNLRGSSPRGACYTDEDVDVDIAKYYIKLPLYDRFVPFNKTSYPLHFRALEDGGRLGILVESRDEDVLFLISEELVFEEVRIVRRERMSEKLVPVEYEGVEEDEEDLLSGIRFWDGEEWVARRTINKAYSRYMREGG